MDETLYSQISLSPVVSHVFVYVSYLCYEFSNLL